MQLRVIVLGIVALSSTARAQPKVLGWSADGDAVIADLDGEKSACTPTEPDKKAACDACTASTCAVVGATPKPATTSPDRSLVLKRSERCWITGHDADIEMCDQSWEVGRLGSVSHTDEVTGRGKRARMTSVFRPDGGAVALVFHGGSGPEEVAVVDLSDHIARRAVPSKVKELLVDQAAALGGSAKVYTADALFFTDDANRGALAPADLAKVVGPGATFQPPEIEPSYDGHAAWASFVVTTTDQRTFRVTELLVRKTTDWFVAGGMWSLGLVDAEAIARAKAGSLPAQTEVARRRQDVPEELSVLGAMLRDGDPELLGLFSKNVRGMLVGTAPAERFVGGARLAAAWKPWLAAGVRGSKVRGAESPRGTSAWLVANVRVTQGKAPQSYELPVRVWAVVDVGGIVLLHAAVTR